MIIRSSISVRILNTTNMSWQKKRLFSVFLRTWLGSNLGHREQQRQRHNLGVVATSSVIALVRTNERPWRGWSIMTSCLRWRTWMCVNESLSAQFFEGTPKTELLLLFLLAATGCCWLRCLLEAYNSSRVPSKPTVSRFFGLCCSAAASHMPLQAQRLWRSRYGSSRSSPLLCDSHGRCLCMCLCVSGVCAVIS